MVDGSVVQPVHCCVRCVRRAPENESAERVVTSWKLEQLEGNEDADHLIAENLLQPGVDRYGRTGWVYSEDVVRRIRKGKMKVGMKQTMTLDPSQALEMQSALLDSDVWSAGVGGKPKAKGKGKAKPKPPKTEMTPEENKLKELEVSVRVTDKALTKMRTTVLVNCQQSMKSKNKIVKSIVKKKEDWLKQMSTYQSSIDGMIADKASDPKDEVVRKKYRRNQRVQQGCDSRHRLHDHVHRQ